MNRRIFLKRVAAVAVGSVVVPIVVKASPCRIFTKHKMLDGRVFYTWAQIKGVYNYKDPPEPFLNEVSKYPKVPIGAIHCAGGGRVYRYMKNCITKQLIAGASC